MTESFQRGLDRARITHVKAFAISMFVFLTAATGVIAAPRRQAVSPFPATHLGAQVAIRDITSASGLVWFTSGKVGFEGVGHVDISGKVSFFPTPGLSPFHISAARDGSVWYSVTVGTRHGVVKVETDGSFLGPLWLPETATITRFAAESYDRVWYIDGKNAKLGSFALRGEHFETDLDRELDASRTFVAIAPDGGVWVAARWTVIRFQHGQSREWVFEDLLRKTDSRFRAITVASNGVVYAIAAVSLDDSPFSPPGSDLVRIDPDGEMRTTRLETHLFPVEVVTDDHEVFVGACNCSPFFREPHLLRIGRSSHERNEILLPGRRFPQSDIAGITVGADGYLWMGYERASFLLRMPLGRP